MSYGLNVEMHKQVMLTFTQLKSSSIDLIKELPNWTF